MATMHVDASLWICMVCGADTYEERAEDGFDIELCLHCQHTIIATFKRVYLSLTGMGQRTYARYFNLEKK